MGKPKDIYPALYDQAGVEVFYDVRKSFNQGATILDVGAGWGKYQKLFPDFVVDACEIWPPYKEELKKNYRKVFIKDVCDLKFGFYDIIIMGDVFEHIEVERAKKLLEYIYHRCQQLYVVVPFLYEQGEVGGNPYEIHLQDDLTPSVMAKRYPL